MPPLPAQPNVLQVKHLFSVGSDLSVSSRLFYVYSGTAPSDATCVAIAGLIYTSVVTNLIPLMCSDNAAIGVSVQDLSSSVGGFGEHVANTAGTRTGIPLPASTCVLMNISIARRYRGGKPRVYWPLGVASDLVSPNQWASTPIASFHSGTSQVIDDTLAISTAGLTMQNMVNISYYQGFTAVLNPITGRTRDVPKVRTAAITPDAFIGTAISAKPGNQRRRIAA